MQRNSLKNPYSRRKVHGFLFSQISLFCAILILTFVKDVIDKGNKDQTTNFTLFFLLIFFMIVFAGSVLFWILSLVLEKKRNRQRKSQCVPAQWIENESLQRVYTSNFDAKQILKLSFFSKGVIPHLEKILAFLFLAASVCLLSVLVSTPAFYIVGGLLFAFDLGYFVIYQMILIPNVLEKKLAESNERFECSFYEEGLAVAGILRGEEKKEQSRLILSFENGIKAKEDERYYYFLILNEDGKENAFCVEKKDFTPSNQERIRQVIRDINSKGERQEKVN